MTRTPLTLVEMLEVERRVKKLNVQADYYLFVVRGDHHGGDNRSTVRDKEATSIYMVVVVLLLITRSQRYILFESPLIVQGGRSV